MLENPSQSGQVFLASLPGPSPLPSNPCLSAQNYEAVLGNVSGSATAPP